MTYIPPNPSGSGWVGGDQANKMRAQSIAQQVTGAQGVRRRIFSGGTILSPIPLPLPRRGIASATRYPLDLTLADAGATYTGTFRPGVVNGLIPSNYLSLTGISKTGLVYIGLGVTLTNAEVQTATFAQGASAPSAFPTSMGVPPTALTILTHVVLDGFVYRVIGPGNPWLTPSAIFETDKAGTISPGEKSTDVWYSYSLTTVA